MFHEQLSKVSCYLELEVGLLIEWNLKEKSFSFFKNDTRRKEGRVGHSGCIIVTTPKGKHSPKQLFNGPIYSLLVPGADESCLLNCHIMCHPCLKSTVNYNIAIESNWEFLWFQRLQLHHDREGTKKSSCWSASGAAEPQNNCDQICMK